MTPKSYNTEETFHIFKRVFGLEKTLEFIREFQRCRFAIPAWSKTALKFLHLDIVIDSRKGLNVDELANKYGTKLKEIKTVLSAHGEAWEYAAQNSQFVVKCRVCRMQTDDMVKHLALHEMSVDEYKEKFGMMPLPEFNRRRKGPRR